MSVIGITASTSRAARRFVASVEKRGATTQVLLPGMNAPLEQILDQIDGLMITGGEDVNPLYYDEDPDADAGLELLPSRDEMEFPLVQSALAQDMPILAICRGMQVLNVILGGKLIQDLPAHRVVRDGSKWVPSFHRIFITPGSKLAAILGSGGFVRVNSLHHQGLREPQKASSLLASAYSIDDGIIEGLESPAHSWVIGLQCHPEREDELPNNWGYLFDGLIEKADLFTAARKVML